MYARSKIVVKLVSAFEQLDDGSALADILITSLRTTEYDGQEFNKRLRKFMRQVVHRNFGAGLSIVTRSDADRLHCHVAVKAPVPCADFDWTSWDESKRYLELYKKSKNRKDLGFYKYYTNKFRTSMPSEWQKLSRRLSAAAKTYKLGYIKIIPIRKIPEAYKWYLVKNIPKKRDDRDKGLHYFTSWNLETTGKFQVINRFTTDFRRRLALVAQRLQLSAGTYNMILRNALGNSWFCRIEEFIKDIDQLTPEQHNRLQDIAYSINTYRLRSDS